MDTADRHAESFVAWQLGVNPSAPLEHPQKRPRLSCPMLIDFVLEHRPMTSLKKLRVTSDGDAPRQHHQPQPLDALPDELLTLVLGYAAAVSRSPGHFIDMLLSSRRLCELGGQAEVLRHLPASALQVSAAYWSPASARFLTRCCQAGNPAAAYALGMVGFYCLSRPAWGLRLLAQAALAHCPEALYSLAVIHFNGSGATKEHRDVAAGVLLCMQAAELGHVDAMRELGHCLQDGYGVRRDPYHGRQLLLRANVEEMAQALETFPSLPLDASPCCAHPRHGRGGDEEDAGQTADEARPVLPSRFLGRSRVPTQQLRRTLSAPPASSAVAWKPADEADCSTARHNDECCASSSVKQAEDLTARTVHDAAAPGAIDAEAPQSNDNHDIPQHHTEQRQQQQQQQWQQQHLQQQQQGAEAVATHSVAQGTAQHCFCLPSVVLPIHARPDGWVRRFLMDWHALESLPGDRSAPSPAQEHEDADLHSDLHRAVAELHPGLREGPRAVEPLFGAGTLAVEEDPSGPCLRCSNLSCGRRELCSAEFRCCSACAEVRYCSRVCQAQHWKAGHRVVCARLAEMRMARAEGAQDEVV